MGWSARRRGAARPSAAGRSDLGSAGSRTDPACRADLGRAASATFCDASASTARTGRRPAGSGMGCAATGCASSASAPGAGATGGPGAATTTSSGLRGPAARAHLGLASG